MPIIKPASELEFLRRVDEAWRLGATQREIAEAEGFAHAASLQNHLLRAGFRFNRIGGLALVDLLTARPLAEWLSSGEMTSQPATAEEVAP